MYLALAAVILPGLWVERVRWRGPFSLRRKERAVFWKRIRWALLLFGALHLLLIAFGVGLVTGALFRWADEFGVDISELLSDFLSPTQDATKIRRLMLTHVAKDALLGVSALWAGLALGRRIRRLEGKCARCAYSLRGLTEPRCPECGNPFNPADLEELAEPPPPAQDRRAE